MGVAGVILYCLLTSGLRGMPGWAAGNLVIGGILGITFRLSKKIRPAWGRIAVNAAAVAVSVAAGILLVKSLTESLLYSQPLLLRIGKNLYAFAADIFVLEFSLPVCMSLDIPIRKTLRMG